MAVCHSCHSSKAHSPSFFFLFINFCLSPSSQNSNSALSPNLWLRSFHRLNFNLITVFAFSSIFAFHLFTCLLTILVCSSLCFSSPEIFEGFPSGNWKLLVEVVWEVGGRDLLVMGSMAFGTVAYSSPSAIWIVGSS